LANASPGAACAYVPLRHERSASGFYGKDIAPAGRPNRQSQQSRQSQITRKYKEEKMSKYYEKAETLRAITTPHYNCAQSVVLAFAEDAGITDETGYALAANFGAGMKIGSTCGAMTGGLMVLGLFGIDDPQTVGSYFRTLRDNHQGCIDCTDLLRISKEQGQEKKAHCDALVYEVVELVEQILRSRGKIE
jgi:C_GCAxxG_C_C family probable redox protein